MNISTRAANASTGLSGAVGNIQQTCPAVTLEIGIFFDGTGNNTANSRRGGSGALMDSYGNARSNVSLLHALYKNGSNYDLKNSCGKPARKFASMYIEGIGTKAGFRDDPVGLGTGMGDYGVEARVYKACIDLGRAIDRLSPGVEPTEIILDVFGFSRGAAAARYFVNCIRQGFIRYNQYYINRLQARVPKDRKFSIRFVGVFDTVAAIGEGTDDDNGPVNVHVATKQAERIYHLTAKNEYRENFRLNHNIPGGGERFEMLGAHSDIGGGYRNPGDNTVVAPVETYTYNTRAEAVAAREAAVRRANAGRATAAQKWLHEGWINETELKNGFLNTPTEVKARPVLSVFGRATWVYYFKTSARLNRPWVKIGLSRIALKKMYHEAKESLVPLTSFPSGNQYTVPQSLADINPTYASGASVTPSETQAKKILHDYGHVSCNYEEISIRNFDGLGMRPDVNFKRVIYPNQPSKAK